MNNNNNDIKELNRALKGEHMAIESFDHFILDAEDEKVKKEFQDIQKKHKTQAVQIAERIQNLAGNPVNSSGAVCVAAEVKFNVSPSAMRYKHGDVLKSAVEGEKMGVEAFNDILIKLTDTSNCTLIANMISENEKIVEQLKRTL